MQLGVLHDLLIGLVQVSIALLGFQFLLLADLAFELLLNLLGHDITRKPLTCIKNSRHILHVLELPLLLVLDFLVFDVLLDGVIAFEFALLLAGLYLLIQVLDFDEELLSLLVHLLVLFQLVRDLRHTFVFLGLHLLSPREHLLFPNLTVRHGVLFRLVFPS